MLSAASLSAVLVATGLLLVGQIYQAIAYSSQQSLSIPLGKDRSDSSPVVASSSVVSLSSDTFYYDSNHIYAINLDIANGIHPATVISTNEVPHPTSIHAILERFKRTDDVFDDSFLHLVILISSTNGSDELSERAAQYLRSLGTHKVIFLSQLSQGVQKPPEGPYFATSQGLLPVWKLYPDTQGAFVASLVQDGTQGLKYLTVSSPESPSNLAIAVPSRLYYTQSEDKPLNGWRVAIKDNIDVAGCRTYASCRAYGELHGVVSTSSPAAQKLLDLGAVIVGKTGMSEFADAEAPTGDFIDFHAPFNPRGDGIRTPGGSSFGSGAAAGAYDWIDFTIGTDTGGSVRQPAAHQAVFGLRPSRGQMSVEGTVIIHRELDAIGVLSKDLSVVHDVTKHYFKGLSPSPENVTESLPSPTLIYPTHLFPIENEAAQRLFDTTVSALERVLNTQRREINLKEEWKKSSWYTGTSFDDYFAPVLYDYVTWGQYHERAPFRNDYKAKFGRDPYVNPVTRLRWEIGSKMTAAHFDDIKTRRRQFQELVEYIFGNNSVMLTPFLWGEPDPRDRYRPSPPERQKADLAWGYRPAFQSPYAGQPELVFAVGQLPVESQISSCQEKYGVVASLIGSSGMDLRIIEITQRLLQEMDLPQWVLTGRTPFQGQ